MDEDFHLVDHDDVKKARSSDNLSRSGVLSNEPPFDPDASFAPKSSSEHGEDDDGSVNDDDNVPQILVRTLVGNGADDAFLAVTRRVEDALGDDKQHGGALELLQDGDETPANIIVGFLPVTTDASSLAFRIADLQERSGNPERLVVLPVTVEQKDNKELGAISDMLLELGVHEPVSRALDAREEKRLAALVRRHAEKNAAQNESDDVEGTASRNSGDNEDHPVADEENDDDDEGVASTAAEAAPEAPQRRHSHSRFFLAATAAAAAVLFAALASHGSMDGSGRAGGFRGQSDTGAAAIVELTLGPEAVKAKQQPQPQLLQPTYARDLAHALAAALPLADTVPSFAQGASAAEAAEATSPDAEQLVAVLRALRSLDLPASNDGEAAAAGTPEEDVKATELDSAQLFAAMHSLRALQVVNAKDNTKLETKNHADCAAATTQARQEARQESAALASRTHAREVRRAQELVSHYESILVEALDRCGYWCRHMLEEYKGLQAEAKEEGFLQPLLVGGP